jgi:predicted acetyltransferase
MVGESSKLRLRPLRDDDEAQALAAQAELEADDNFVFLLGWDPNEPWASYVSQHEHHRRGLAVPEGWVPSTFLIAEVAGNLVGRVSIRHELNEFLTDVGGHIGYAVRPLYRGRGLATEILRQALVIARAEGVNEVLVTCDEGNIASARVIEKLGGRLEDVRIDERGVPKRRYRIV